MRARTYDPATAQFLSTDPLAGITRSLYNYAGENPLTYDDPTGLFFGELVEGAEAVSLPRSPRSFCRSCRPSGSSSACTKASTWA
jgi:hypothetical protein